MSNKYVFSMGSQVYFGEALEYWELRRKLEYSFLQAGFKMFIHLNTSKSRVLSAYHFRQN